LGDILDCTAWKMTAELSAYESASSKVMREEDLFCFRDSEVL